MALVADFWNPETSANKGVKRYSSDPTKYSVPDSGTVGKLSMGYAPVMIPAATRGGGSSGFDATRAGVAHIDPDAPDGGVIVDMAKMARNRDATNRMIKQAVNPVEAFYRAGEQYDPQQHQFDAGRQMAAARQSPGELDENVDVEYVAAEPRVRPQQLPVFGRQVERQPAQEPPRRRKRKRPVEVVEPTQADGVAALLAALRSMTPGFGGSPAEPQPAAARPVEVAQVRFGRIRVDQPHGEQPELEAFFDLGSGGLLSTRYHDIVSHALGVVLVYDTRFKLGSQFMPPKGRTVMLTSPATGPQPVAVAACGLNFQLGPLELCVMIYPIDLGEDQDEPHPLDAPVGAVLQST